MQLFNWLKEYIKFKDCAKKQIRHIDEKSESIRVQEKKEAKTYFVHEELEKILDKGEEHKTYFVCLNNKKNIKTLLDNWNELVKQKNLTILFANPTTNEVWSIHPATHEKIAEKESLKEGIKSLHSSIQVLN